MNYARAIGVASLALAAATLAGCSGDAAAGDKTGASKAAPAEQVVERTDKDLCLDEIREWADDDDDLLAMDASAVTYDPDIIQTMFERHIADTRELAAQVDDADLRGNLEEAADASQDLSDSVSSQLAQSDWLIGQRPILEAELAVLSHCYVTYGDDDETSETSETGSTG